MKKSSVFRILALWVAASFVLAACSPAATAVVPPTAVIQVQTQIVKETQIVNQTQVVNQTQIVEVTPTAGPNPEAVIEGVESGAEIGLWTFYLSPTFDDYIKST